MISRKVENENAKDFECFVYVCSGITYAQSDTGEETNGD
jgi:hypothetical protein